MHYVEVLLVLQLAVVALIFWAERLRIAYPVFLVLGGIAAGFIPGMPHPHLNPNIVFLVFLPPVLHYAAFLTDWREFRANGLVIGALAIVLVLFTTGVVALVAHEWLGMPWAAACILGAIVSPPDAVAASAVTQTMRIPRNLTTIIEGESLVNDATALVIYQFAVAALVSGTFSAPEAGQAFVVEGFGGVAYGLALGWVSGKARLAVRGSPVALMIILTSPFFIYVTAAQLGLSGVLATVAGGALLSRVNLEKITPADRMQARAVWDAVVLIINGFAFMLIGLQLPHIAVGIDEQGGLGALVWPAILICTTVILARFLFILPAYAVLRAWRRRRSVVAASPANVAPRVTVGWRGATLLSWAGMRGIVSLAAAMALPLTLVDGTTPLPFRQEIVFLTFMAIIATLVVQGLTLPIVIHWLGLAVSADDRREEAAAQQAMAETALAELDQIRTQEKLPGYFEAYLRERYREIVESSRRDSGEPAPDHLDYPHRASVLRRLLEAERRKLLHLRNTAQISDEVFRRILERLDHREATL